MKTLWLRMIGRIRTLRQSSSSGLSRRNVVFLLRATPDQRISRNDYCAWLAKAYSRNSVVTAALVVL